MNLLRIKRIIIGYTTLAAWRKCPQYWAYRYGQQLKSLARSDREFGSALEFGGLFHKGMEFWHGAKGTRDQLIDFVINEATKTALINVAADEHRSIEHLRELLTAYIEQYPTETFTVQALEQEQDVVLQPGTDTKTEIVWRAHIDGRITFDNGVQAIMEHKTSSGDLMKGFTERMLPNDQAVGYSFVASSDHTAPLPVYFNGVTSDRKAIQPAWQANYRKKYKKEPPVPFYRHLVRIEPWMLAEWKVSVLRDCNRLIEDIYAGQYSKNAPDACTVFNSRCAFADLCKIAPTERPHMIEFAYDMEPWHGWEIEWTA